ncbi:MAG: hypothetical protein LC725_08895 [Lentisphaerae bacterium]|nr:hypothetical protein [Lentisphaerota bacterium]
MNQTARGQKSKSPSYNLMWHTAPYGPYFGDIGLGIGLVKVAGNNPKAMPLCPALLRMDPAQDQPALEWRANSGNQAMGGMDPDIDICPELRLIRRKWTPECLKSFYKYGDTKITQQMVVGPGGVYGRIKAARPVQLQLQGISLGACKLRGLPDGLQIIETQPQIAPCEFTVRFSFPPSTITCEGQPLAADDVRFYPGKARWTFTWDQPLESLEIDVETQRSFNPGLPELAPLSRDGSACIAQRQSGNFARTLKQQKREWAEYFANDVPVIDCPDPRVNQLNQYLAWVYLSNTIQHGGILPYPYSIPKQTFVGWWMWDTAKSAIAGSWYGRREVAWGGMLNTENLQYDARHPDAGVITNSARYSSVDCWYSERPESNRYPCVPYAIPEKHGSGTHPPMYSLAVWSLWSVDGNDMLMKRLLSNLLAMDAYFERIRASRQVPGLLVVLRWSDSGMDNSKRWANQCNRCLSGRQHFDDTDWELPVISVDLNVYSITEKRCLAEMCRKAGMTQEAERLEAEAGTREKTLHRELWNEEKSLYFDRVEADGRFTPILSPTNLSPFMLPGLPRERVAPMLRWLFDEDHFWGEYPIPSIAKSDRDFEPSKGYWMGPVWMSYPMDILRGLAHHDRGAAARLLDRLINIMLPDGEPAINENYQPLTGLPLECPNFSWNGQIIDIIMRDMFGISCRDGQVSATSAGVPDDWDHWKVANVRLHGRRYDISAVKTQGQWRHEIVEV